MTTGVKNLTQGTNQTKWSYKHHLSNIHVVGHMICHLGEKLKQQHLTNKFNYLVTDMISTIWTNISACKELVVKDIIALTTLLLLRLPGIKFLRLLQTNWPIYVAWNLYTQMEYDFLRILCDQECVSYFIEIANFDKRKTSLGHIDPSPLLL